MSVIKCKHISLLYLNWGPALGDPHFEKKKLLVTHGKVQPLMGGGDRDPPLFRLKQLQPHPGNKRPLPWQNYIGRGG